MLQQTRVETVVPYYERFLDRFPTLEALAIADEEDVLRQWAGLGYYARARNMRRAAEQVLSDHGGRFPREDGPLLALPGIGRYTSGAIRSIAFGDRAPIVDGNVTRVLARLEALKGPSGAALWGLAETLVPEDTPGEFNQALMELGATVCTPRSPSCGPCPLRTLCRGTGSPQSFPEPRARAGPREAFATAALVRHRRRQAVLVSRRPSRGLLGGLWELPNVEGHDVRALRRHLRDAYGIRATASVRLGKVDHVFSHRALALEIVGFESTGNGVLETETARFCTAIELGDLPLSALMRKSLALGGVRVPGRTRSNTKG
jgi:A/G-specific adenine glycosylase